MLADDLGAAGHEMPDARKPCGSDGPDVRANGDTAALGLRLVNGDLEDVYEGVYPGCWIRIVPVWVIWKA
jgi:hypothetical protein